MRPPFTTLHKNLGFNNMSNKAMKGKVVEDLDATLEMAAWFKGFK